MKVHERKLARKLRSKGLSLRAIVTKVKCSKGAVSKWISDMQLTDAQIERLKSNQDKGRAKAAKHPNSSKQKWEAIRNSCKNTAKNDIPKEYSPKLLNIVGAALYWAEGYTRSKNAIVFANSNPYMIKLMMSFFRKTCNIPESKFRGKLSIHPHLDVKKAEKYWSRISKIPLIRFNKTLLAVSKSSQGKKDTLPMGTFRILIGDVYTCSKIKGWIEGLCDWTEMGG